MSSWKQIWKRMRHQVCHLSYTIITKSSVCGAFYTISPYATTFEVIKTLCGRQSSSDCPHLAEAVGPQIRQMIRQTKVTQLKWSRVGSHIQISNHICFLASALSAFPQSYVGLYAREGHGNLLQDSCLENPMDTGAWWATVQGVTKSQRRLSD